MKEDFFSIKPKSKLLDTLIDHYYFQDVSNEGGKFSVVYYPNYKTALNYYKNAAVTWDNVGRIITQIEKKSDGCIFTQNTKTSRYVTIQGSVGKIGIVFKPLGINHFIPFNLIQITEASITSFDYFGNSLTKLLEYIYPLKSTEEKRDYLDKFFIENYIGLAKLHRY